MSRIVINDLKIESDIKEISFVHAINIVGGREVIYWDQNGDGIADYKVIIRDSGTIVFRPLS
jgi:hypothetical protein